MKFVRGLVALLVVGACVVGCVEKAPHPSLFGYLFVLASALVAGALGWREARRGGASRGGALRVAAVLGVLGALPFGVLLAAVLGMLGRSGMSPADTVRFGASMLGPREREGHALEGLVYA